MTKAPAFTAPGGDENRAPPASVHPEALRVDGERLILLVSKGPPAGTENRSVALPARPVCQYLGRWAPASRNSSSSCEEVLPSTMFVAQARDSDGGRDRIVATAVVSSATRRQP